MADTLHLGPMTPQTEVLTNVHLLYTIFTLIPLASDNRDSYLAQCVSVSYTFHETAIRVLWRNLDSLLPLWHLLAPSSTPFPHGYLNPSLRREDEGKILEYLQAVSSAELYRDPVRWRRVLDHAAHVRKIALRVDATSAIRDLNTLLARAVLAQNGGISMLPLLHAIVSFSPRNDTLTSFFTLTLRHAMFTLSWSSETQIVSSLRKLRDACPFLEKIDLHSSAGVRVRPGSGLGLSLIQELATFSRLREVQISECTESEVFRLLATGPNLRCLDVRRVTTGVWVGPDNDISVYGLHQLSLNGDTSTLSRLFGRIRFHALNTASIRLCDSTETQLTATDVNHALALFYNAASTSDFQNLQFTPMINSFQNPSSNDDMPTLRDLIAPILPIRSLRSFTLSAAPGAVASLHDGDIIAIASAWPTLRHLCLDSGFTAKSHVSISVIHHLHTHCTGLQHLSIPHIRWPTIGVERIPEPLGHSPSHPLRELSLSAQFVVTADLPLFGPDLSDRDVEAMVRYLLDLFPCLDLDHCRREWGSAKARSRRKYLPQTVCYDDRWRKVIGHTYLMCRARDGL